MLGKGLESLIPKKQNVQSAQQDQQISPTEMSAERARLPSETRENEVKSQGAGEQLSPDGRSPEGREQADRGFLKTKPLSKDAIFHIEIHKIKPNPHQPRRYFDEESLKELANSIREHGILQPLVVSKIEKETEYGSDVEYQLIAGERRLRAAQMIGLERVPAIVKNVAKDAERLEMAIVENLQRSDLNPIETARAYAKLQDVFGLTQQEIATRLGKSRETIANTLRLLKLPTEIQDAVSKNQINESQARLILTIENPAQQQNLFKEIIGNNLSVRELRSRLRANRQPKTENQQQTTTLNPEIIGLEEKLTEFFGAKVKIKQKEKGGEIIIEFYSPEEIEGIIQKIAPTPSSLPKENY
jgi:ParB family chromosome partitioning protein